MNAQLIEQYVAGKLDETAAAAFEEYCLAHPEVARLVEFEQRLKSGIQQVSRGSTAEFVRSDYNGLWKFAAAASLLLFVAANGFLWQRLRSTEPHVLAAVTAETQHSRLSMRLALVRGADSMPQLPDGVVRVEIVGLFDPGYQYSVALDRLQKNRSFETLATLYGQRPSSPVTLELMIDSNQLDSGSYTFRVRKQASAEDSLDFGFVKP
jgi:hypothetical protein